MYVVSKKDLISAELETMRTSRSPTTVMTARCKQEKKPRYTSKVMHQQIFLGKLCEDHVKTYIGKDRVVLRGDVVKSDSGSCAEFTEQGSSASQVTTAKVMDVIATRL